MKRRLFNLLAAASLLMLMATVSLWVRGRYACDMLHYNFEHRALWVQSSQGLIVAGTEGQRGPQGLYAWSDQPQTPYRIYYDLKNPQHEFGDFAWSSRDRPLGAATTIAAPHWSFLLLSVGGFLPYLAGVIHRRLRSQIRHGFCSACGYNLTGNVSGVCPECGTRIPTDPAAENLRRADD